jgi:predicted nucleic acid-binding protein
MVFVDSSVWIDLFNGLVTPESELLGRARAIRVAEHTRALRKAGVTARKATDAVIATYCIEQRMPLLYSDRDFDPFVQHLGLRRAT